jgi:hypothetical protein
MPSKMTRKQLAEVGVELYGERAWQTRMAEELGVDGSTVRRWVSGAVPIPQPVIAALNCFLDRKRGNGQ